MKFCRKKFGMVPRARRRRVLQALSSAALLQACAPSPVREMTLQARPATPPAAPVGRRVHLFAPSGISVDTRRLERAVARLQNAGFAVDNVAAGWRRFQRFAGSDAERTADLQGLLAHNAPLPDVLLGVRGGYGANRILAGVDWPRLAAKMREQGTLLFGFSDVCAVQLALLAQGDMPSFAGPMLYSEFGKEQLSLYTMQHFIDAATRPDLAIEVPYAVAPALQVEGVFWGGNLSVLTSLVGSPYLPDVRGGILFLEDVGEQPYRIERMLYTLHLAGVLKKQQAIILGDFRMGGIADTYDESYGLGEVIQQISSVAGVPVLTGFPFGHIEHKATFPLGARCRLQSSGAGYSVRFFDYPLLDAASLRLDALLAESLASASASAQNMR